MPIGPVLLPKSGTPAATCAPWRKSVSVLKSEKHRTEILLGENPWISGLEDIPPLRFGRVLAISDDFLGDFPRVLATWYHFSGNFHRYVLSFRLGVPIPDPFLEDAAMASPKRRAGAVFGVGNTSPVYQPYTNIVALFTGYKCVLYSYQTPMASMCCIRSEVEIHDSARAPN